MGSVPSAAAGKSGLGQGRNGWGMVWSEAGGDAVCSLRVRFKSERDQWDAFWQASLPRFADYKDAYPLRGTKFWKSHS